MMRPLAHFLEEFRPAGATAAPAAACDGPVLLPDLRDLHDGPSFTLEEPDLLPSPDSLDALDQGFDTPLALLPPPVPIEDPVPAIDLAALEAEHAEALATARATWAGEEGERLANRIDRAFDGLFERLSEALAPILEPFLALAAQTEVVKQLGDAVTKMLATDDARAITVSGPADLLAALQDHCGDRPGIRFAESAAADVTVTLGETRIRSQLGAWARHLEAALGAPA